MTRCGCCEAEICSPSPGGFLHWLALTSPLGALGYSTTGPGGDARPRFSVPTLELVSGPLGSWPTRPS